MQGESPRKHKASQPHVLTLTQFKQKLDALVEEVTRGRPPHSQAVLYLGRKGELNALAALLPKLPRTDLPQAGRSLNQAKAAIATYFAAPRIEEEEWLDVTKPASPLPVGHLHLVSQAIKEITRIFEKVGFTRVRYPEVEWDWYAFESLNMPTGHPARDEWETFFIDAPPHPKLGAIVLTPHTSNGQVREMQRLRQPPIRMINIAKCYRRQQDVTHLQMFHQFEGLVIDTGIGIHYLKGTIDYFAREFYGEKGKSRLRPFHFQFTEPSFEVDFTCTICDGKGELPDHTPCRYCKSGWHEVGGAGMVHPQVLRNGGIDPEKFTGFAFGWGVERSYTLKPELKIDDVRLIYGNDIRFLEQF